MRGNKLQVYDEDSDEEQKSSQGKEVLRLTHAEVAQTMRLTYALCYASIQGRTIRNKHILLMDTMHRKFFTMRHLIVGISSVAHGQYVHLPTLKAECALVQRAESVRYSY